MIVDQHQPVVEKYYGRGKMKSVVGRLLEECDRVVKTNLESWDEERSTRRRVSCTLILVANAKMMLLLADRNPFPSTSRHVLTPSTYETCTDQCG